MPRTRSTPFRSSRGFTILEVAGAATVLALTLTGMIGVVEAGSRMLDLSRKQTVAAQILHSELEETRLSGWTTVSNLVSYNPAPTIDSNFNATSNGFALSRSISVLQTDSSSNPTEVQVTFTVKWKGITGTAYSRTSSTHVAKNGIYTAYQRS